MVEKTSNCITEINKPKLAYVTNLVIEIENAVKLLDTGMHNAYRNMATKKPKTYFKFM